MPQTRLAILAMALLSLLALQFQRDVATTRTQMIVSEVDLVASGVGTEHLDRVGAMSFEEITDLHEDQRAVLVTLDSNNESTLSFDLTSTVRYVAMQGNAFVEVKGPTDYQEVLVTIQGLLNSTVTMSRIYSRVST